jgi:zinc protease
MAFRLGYALDDAFYGIEPEGHLARFQQTMDELTSTEVNASIKKHWQTDDLFVAIVTGDAAGLKGTIASGVDTPINYPNPMPEKILAEDREIAAYPLHVEAQAIETVAVTSIFA